MQIIEAIKISYFRSFSQTVVIKGLKDLNIFSGKNDSGKSNILKALHLFFSEDQIDSYNALDFDIDFSKVQLQKSKQQQIKRKIQISVLFHRGNFSKAVLPERFWVEKAWGIGGEFLGRKTKNHREQLITHNERTTKVEASTTSFLKNIQFFHVPAIKDKGFLEYLKSEYQQSLANKMDSEEEDLTIPRSFKSWKEKASVKEITALLTEKINQEATEMMRQFLDSSQELSTTEFSIPELDYSEVLEIITEHNIPLSSRGDGVQAKLIPQMLNQIAKNNGTKLVIWGFEEPENSFEYKNAQSLADQFKGEYSANQQIFLTSHAFNFITLDGDNVESYRVWRPSFEEGTQVAQVHSLAHEYREKLEEELGIYQLNQELEAIFKQKQSELNELNELREKLSTQLDKPTLLVEDKYDQIYKIAWLKLNDVSCSRTNFERKFDETSQFRIVSADGCSHINGLMRTTMTDLWSTKPILGLFDYDQAGVSTFKEITKKWYSKNKDKYKEKIQGNKESGHYIVHPEQVNMKCLLLPIPDTLKDFASLDFPSLVEIEHLLPDDFLLEHSFADIKPTTGGASFLEIDSSKKSKIWESLFDLQKEDFKDFIPLFTAIEDFLLNS